jgi:hypothetical protein
MRIGVCMTEKHVWCYLNKDKLNKIAKEKNLDIGMYIEVFGNTFTIGEFCINNNYLYICEMNKDIKSIHINGFITPINNNLFKIEGSYESVM